MAPPRLLLGLLLLQTALTEDVKKLTALVGGAIEMVPVFNGVVQGFEWKKGSNKIIEIDFPSGDPKHYALKDRSNLDLTTGVLTIRRLQLTDSGSYTADVLINGQYQKTAFELLVFPALNKPPVSCNFTNGDALVRCHHVPDPSTYEWYNDGKPIASSLKNYSLTDQNRNLTVGHLDWKNVKSLECVVKNPVSENRSSVPETCFEKVSSRRWVSGLIAALVIVPLILVILYGFFGPENSWLRRLFDPLRKRIQGLFDRLRKRIQGYVAAARNEDPNSRRGSKSEDGRSANPNVDGSADGRAEASPESLSAPLKTNQNETGYNTAAQNDDHNSRRGSKSEVRQSDNPNDDGSADGRAEASPESLSAPLKTNQNKMGYNTTAQNDDHNSRRGSKSEVRQSDNPNDDGSADGRAEASPESLSAPLKTNQNKMGYDPTAHNAPDEDHNSRIKSTSDDRQSDNRTADRTANEENPSSHAAIKRADAVPYYPPAPLDFEMTEGASKEEVQDPSEGDPLSPASQETASSKDS